MHGKVRLLCHHQYCKGGCIGSIKDSCEVLAPVVDAASRPYSEGEDLTVGMAPVALSSQTGYRPHICSPFPWPESRSSTKALEEDKLQRAVVNYVLKHLKAELVELLEAIRPRGARTEAGDRLGTGFRW